MNQKELYHQSIELLKQLIATPSFSGEEGNTALLISSWLETANVDVNRFKNNIWAKNKYFDESKPSLLLNSHHDTVKPNKAYTNAPFEPLDDGTTLHGLGSNDAGGSLVALLAVFTHFYPLKNLAYNVIIAATAEEENSGPNGLNQLMQFLPPIDFAIVGEPTQMQLAVAEKGLIVIDASAKGIPGHAAHNNTINPIAIALDDIQLIHRCQFPKTSEFLGDVKLSVTQIQAGEQHNVVPAQCQYVIDVRVNEHYSNQEIFKEIDRFTKSELKARSFKHNSSSISLDHPIVKAGLALGRKTYGSPTLSDQAVLTCPSLKMGPGNSKRSHQANEYIYLAEIEEGIHLYIQILNQLLLP